MLLCALWRTIGGQKMSQYLQSKRILLGVTGSIAAYKSADLVRRLRDAGAQVRVVMTESAKEFITPLTMQAVSGHPVHDELFDLQAEAAMGHIELARWADLLVIAPATADCMARLVGGKADDLLTTLCLASQAPLLIAPAMNQNMWKHTSTQENLQALHQKGFYIVGPGEGIQACGDVGYGRMSEPVEIVDEADKIFATGLLAGVRVLLTAGPTHEAIDPVRYIANGSSGKMGYALAEAAREAGASVTLISGPTHLTVPRHVECIHVVSAQEMYDAVMANVSACDLFVGVAAVADYRSETVASSKLHKDGETMTLTLIRNPDIIASVGALADKPFIVGFAAETDHVVESAKAKMQRKCMNMIIANQVGGGLAMNADDNCVTVISANSEIALETMPKQQLARKLITIISEQYKKD